MRLNTLENELHTCDSLDEVDFCLRCTAPKCKGSKDCPFRLSAKKNKGRLVANEEVIAKMVKDGWTNNAICRELGISIDRLHSFKRKCYENGTLTKYCINQIRR